MEKIKILISGIGSTRGGIGSVVCNVLKYINRSVFEPVVLLTYDSVLEKEIKEIGVEIKKITAFGVSIWKYRQGLEKIFAENHYDYVWINNTSKVDIVIFKTAKKYGVRTIAHSHGESVEGSFMKKLVYRVIELFTSRIFYKNLDIALSCSDSSARYFYNRKYSKNHTIHVLRNSIDTDRFAFNVDKRSIIRKDIRLCENDKAIVAVGRITEVKNPLFLLDVLKILPNDYKLLFIGSGELLDVVKKSAAIAGLSDRVKFLGMIDNVNDMLNAMDIFVLPSLHEGFPVSAIEAQTNGLYSILSDNVTTECVLTEICFRIGLNAEDWAKKIKDKRDYDRGVFIDVIKRKGFDNRTYVEEFERIIMQDKENA